MSAIPAKKQRMKPTTAVPLFIMFVTLLVFLLSQLKSCSASDGVREKRIAHVLHFDGDGRAVVVGVARVTCGARQEKRPDASTADTGRPLKSAARWPKHAR